MAGFAGTSPNGAGAMLRLIRDGRARTHAELVELTGLSRSTVAQRVDSLLTRQLVVPAEPGASRGGRPPRTFAFNRDAGVVLAADLGATHSRVAVTDLAGDVLAETREDIPIAQGPGGRARLARAGARRPAEARPSRQRGDVRGVGVGVPGPVEFVTGTPVAPPIMPGWDGYGVAAHLRERYGAPVLVDNDVNIMALGEYWARWRDTDHLLFVKVGTGIGCGVITDGRIHRGAQGAAGDIGHIHVPDHDDVICRCGNLGCLEAIAGGGAMAARLTGARHPRRQQPRRRQAGPRRAARRRCGSSARPAASSAACSPAPSTSSTPA